MAASLDAADLPATLRVGAWLKMSNTSSSDLQGSFVVGVRPSGGGDRALMKDAQTGT